MKQIKPAGGRKITPTYIGKEALKVVKDMGAPDKKIPVFVGILVPQKSTDPKKVPADLSGLEKVI